MSWLANNPTAPKIGLFLQVDGNATFPRLYDEVADLIVAADALGFHSARVTQHHFGERNGWLPSPLPFLAAVGQRAKRIQLGTVVITVPLEHPLRLAEDAAVTDWALGGRLELGLGSGLGAEVFNTFGADFESRRARTYFGVGELLKALGGEELNEQGQRLAPPAGGLLDRLWYAAMSAESATYAAKHNLGLLLGRVEHGGGSPLANQTKTSQVYRASLAPHTPVRIAAGRTIYPAIDRATAERELTEALAANLTAYTRSGLVPANATISEVLARLHYIYGHPEEIAATLAAEQAAIGWTELLVQINPGNVPQQKALQALELVANEIVPRLAELTAKSKQLIRQGS